MGLPKLATTGMSKKDSSDNEREKKEVVFKSSQRDHEKFVNNDPGFRVNHILKNARETN
jgi:hypothetical protein